MSEEFVPRPGAVRYKVEGTWFACNPRDPMYSTATMLATEFWDTTAQAWRPIDLPESDDE